MFNYLFCSGLFFQGITVALIKCLCENNSQKGLPLETRNTYNQENRRLGLIESPYMHHCSLR